MKHIDQAVSATVTSSSHYPHSVQLHGTFTDIQLSALAALCKRIGFDDFKELSKDETEAYQMRDGVYALKELLSQHGF